MRPLGSVPTGPGTPNRAQGHRSIERPPLDVIGMGGWGYRVDGGPEPEIIGPQNLQTIDALLRFTVSGETDFTHP